jgi:hypothetical protein
MSRALMVLALMAFADRAHAQSPKGQWPKEPDTYRGIRWQAPISEAAERVGNLSCLCEYKDMARSPCQYGDADADKTPETRNCLGDLTIGSITMKEMWSFTQDKFVGAGLSFSSDDFEKLRDIFIERYGPPTSSTEDDLQTRMGAKATNRTLIWQGRAVTITLQRFSGTITEGYASIETNAHLAQKKKDSEKEKLEGAKVF